MNNVFDEQIKEALDYAQKLKLCGEGDLSLKLCKKAVREASLHHGEDMICLFYGVAAYNKIKSVTDAAAYIFVARCAKDLYDILRSMESEKSAFHSWATAGDKNSDRSMVEFFTWLNKEDRKPSANDVTHFKSAMSALTGGKKLVFKMSDRVKLFRPLEIVRGLVGKSIIINQSGVLHG